MKVAKEFECNAGLDSDLRARVQSASKQLDVLRNRPLTIAVLNCNLMDSICMENQHIDVAWNRIPAVHAGMVKLYLKSQSFE